MSKKQEFVKHGEIKEQYLKDKKQYEIDLNFVGEEDLTIKENNRKYSKFTRDMLPMVEELSAYGFNYAQICNIMNLDGVNLKSRPYFKNLYVEFLECIDNGKLKMESKLARALHNKCLVTKETTKVTKIRKDNSGNIIGSEETITEKSVTPDTTALKYALANINIESNKWKDKQITEIVSSSEPEEIKEMSDEELKAKVDEKLKLIHMMDNKDLGVRLDDFVSDNIDNDIQLVQVM